MRRESVDIGGRGCETMKVLAAGSRDDRVLELVGRIDAPIVFQMLLKTRCAGEVHDREIPVREQRDLTRS